VGRAILPADQLSSWSSRLERRLRPRLAAPRKKVCGNWAVSPVLNVLAEAERIGRAFVGRTRITLAIRAICPLLLPLWEDWRVNRRSP